MSKRNVGLFLVDILEAIEKIERYTEGLTLDEFWENDLVADAVVRDLEVIGEAVQHAPEALRACFSGANWHRVVCFRNVVIREYFAVDLEIIWTIMTKTFTCL